MHTISKDAYDFLIKAYEEHVERFFDDPTEYADGSPLREVYDELKKLGEEFELDIKTFAMDDDLDRLKEFIGEEEGFGLDGPAETYSGVSHMDMGVSPNWPRPVYFDSDEQNKSVEDKLKKISQDRHDEKEMVGWWSTYEMEE